MTCHNEPHEHDYRTVTATGDLAAFLHRHNRLLIVAAAAALAVLMVVIF